MEKYLFMKPVLKFISEGKSFNRLFAIILRILAGAVVFIGFVGWVIAWKTVFSLDSLGIIGGILFQLFYVVAVYVVVHSILIRVNHIANLPDSEYVVIPVFSLSLRMLGEIYAGFCAIIAVGGGIFTWFSGYTVSAIRNFDNMTPFVPHLGNQTFYGGLTFMVGGLFVAFCALVTMYFLSEMVVAFLDIARNLRVTRQIIEQNNKSKG